MERQYVLAHRSTQHHTVARTTTHMALRAAVSVCFAVAMLRSVFFLLLCTHTNLVLLPGGDTCFRACVCMCWCVRMCTYTYICVSLRLCLRTFVVEVCVLAW